jgi:YD repeat-containing protein
MVAIFTGPGSGFERGSRAVVGPSGLLGDALLGNAGEQVFYNAFNGNLLVSQRDEFLVGRGPDVAIARTYNSKGDFSDDNGDNWRQSTDRRVYGQTGTVNAAGSTIKRVSGDGSVIGFSWNDAQDLYIGTDGEGAYDSLSFNAGTGLWTWTDGDTGICETYEASASAGSWRIAQQYDRDGNSVTFSYDAGGRLDKATTADGGYVQYSWDTANDRITAIVTGYADLTTMLSKTLTRTSYSYDTATGKLAKITVDLTPTNTADNVSYSTDYAYDASGRLNSISQTDGSFLDMDYDTSGRVIRFTQTSVGAATRVTNIWYGTGYTRITDPAGHISRFHYDANGSLTSIQVDPAAAGAGSQVWSFGYNSNGDLISATDPAGNATTYSDYDEHGNAWTETNRLGTVTRRTWNERNRLLTDTRIGSDQGDSYANHTTRYIYDGEDHLRYVLSPEGRVVEYRYNGVGQQVSMIAYAAEGPDVSGLSISESKTEAELNAWVAEQTDKSQAQRTDTFYDHRGNVSRTVTYATLSTFGEGTAGPLAVTPGANSTVTALADGLYRVAKTAGANYTYNADAHSAPIRTTRGSWRGWPPRPAPTPPTTA